MSEKSIFVCATGFVAALFIYFCKVCLDVWQLFIGG